MFDIGFLELMVVAILGLLVLGPERLPKAARSLGLLIGKVRRTMSNIQDDLERHARTEELREKLKDPYATFMDDDQKQKTATSASADSNNAHSAEASTSSAASATNPPTPSSATADSTANDKKSL
ncbi:Sec-independent protein translocase protein TatB [Bacterioplanoides sp.]|uniref:Sec-independent protein translocase protein TatB n=1 Tax=Bacterioplanoides sp. TaxID=2066072 RepID=UPI003B00F974